MAEPFRIIVEQNVNPMSQVGMIIDFLAANEIGIPIYNLMEFNPDTMKPIPPIRKRSEYISLW